MRTSVEREWFGRWIDLQRAGRTYGGLGQAPKQQLGEPLPGTAPPPGTVIPPGLVQFLPDPADGPTPPPGLISAAAARGLIRSLHTDESPANRRVRGGFACVRGV